MELSDREYNERLINVFAFRVGNGMMTERSALTIVKDLWRNGSSSEIMSVWKKEFRKKVILERGASAVVA